MIELNMNAQTSEWKIESELMECTFYSQVLLFLGDKYVKLQLLDSPPMI